MLNKYLFSLMYKEIQTKMNYFEELGREANIMLKRDKNIEPIKLLMAETYYELQPVFPFLWEKYPEYHELFRELEQFYGEYVDQLAERRMI